MSCTLCRPSVVLVLRDELRGHVVAIVITRVRAALDIMDVVGACGVWCRGLPNGLSAHTSRRYRPHVRFYNHSPSGCGFGRPLSLIHISEPTRLGMISYAVFCLKKKK